MIQKTTVIAKVKYLLKVPETDSALDTSNTISRAREILADTIAPYRWSDEQLSNYLNDGISEIKNLRSDMELWDGAIPGAFQQPAANYIVYRALALDNDAQNNNGALSDKYLTLFAQQTNAIRFYFTDEQIGKYADEAANDIVSRRSDLRISENGALKDDIIVSDGYDIPERFTDALCQYAAFRGAVHSQNNSAEYFLSQYQGAIATI